MTDKEAIEWIENGYFVIANNKLYAVNSSSKMIKHAEKIKFMSEFCEWEDRDKPEEHEKLKKRFPNHSVRMIDDTRVNVNIRDLIVPLQEEEQKMIKPSVIVVDKLTYNDIVDEKLRILIKTLDGMAQSRGYLSAIKTVETPTGLIKNTERDYVDAIHQIASFFKNNE